MRAKLAQGFTLQKMKGILSTLHDCGIKLQQHLCRVTDDNECVEICEIIDCYTASAIASAIFGIDIDCMADANHPFRNVARQLFEVNAKNGLRHISLFVCPMLVKWSGLRQVDRSVQDYLLNLVAQTLELREQKNVVRNDFFQFLVEIHSSSTPTKIDEWKPMTKKDKRKSLSFEQVAAQAFGLLMTGVHSSSLATSSCLYEIAKHPDIQRKIRAEIDLVMAQHNGKLSYESINELKYLNCCINGMEKFQFKIRKVSHESADFTM